MSVSLILVGGGKMGGAMLEGWLERGLEADAVVVVEPNSDIAEDLRTKHGVKVAGGIEAVPVGFTPDVIVFAVKPQVMDEVTPAYRRFEEAKAVHLSIAAGKTIASFEKALGAGAAIVRAMPNTPAAIRQGITVGCPNPRVAPEQQRICHDLLEAVGEVHWVDDEGQIDAVTAVSGSGPAYVFLLAEVLGKAGAVAGLSEDLAARLARVTVSGAGALLAASAAEPSTLRQNVTSPGGTTAAALEVLMAEGDGLAELLAEAVDAATRRSKELAG